MALFPLGILSAGGAGGETYELISTSLITTNTASVSFDVSSLASTYRHLQLRVVGRDSAATDESTYFLRLNSDTTNANYNYHGLVGLGSSVISFSATAGITLPIAGANQTANSFIGSVYDILDPFSTTKNKTIRGLGGHTALINRIALVSGLWRNTNSVTNITLASVANFVSGTRFSLYGIRG
jgi:hypothetical protein